MTITLKGLHFELEKEGYRFYVVYDNVNDIKVLECYYNESNELISAFESPHIFYFKAQLFKKVKNSVRKLEAAVTMKDVFGAGMTTLSK